ncbi:tetratricopeptide repeat protein 19, mitochondrial isoform X2 [Chiroxiphia lanceolata]|uniref:tetratricopeptide repeat protein 19, mitochondrial isoform X2 n=1 Tax=Chiroxiphia lanceolata TaxID=296741 RepID=UPI0013CEB688|nr:tetratricopeptide repeat protein 19, mitochondrial isoform X2 [Chiroxiphia lanceolata]
MAAVPRVLSRLRPRRCPAVLRPCPAGPRGHRGQRGGTTGTTTALARQRWARPAGAALAFLGGLSLFPRDAEEEEGEDAIILLLKKAKLSVMKGELAEAERLLHQALRLSHQEDNRQAIAYTYSVMANVAFMQGQLDNAEKLYKASMSYLLAGDMKEDDNAILEMSLKLASIYAAQKQDKLAIAGYQFCILTLEEKIAKQKDLPEDVLPAEEKANTRLLLGMSLDSYARYLLSVNQLPAAQKMYEKALQIANDVQGETHPQVTCTTVVGPLKKERLISRELCRHPTCPALMSGDECDASAASDCCTSLALRLPLSILVQTVVLLNDLATVLDAQGHHDEAYSYVKRAAELARETQHPEEHMVLNNLAAILMHKDFLQAKLVYKEALKQAQQKGDVASVQHIQEELAELAKRRKGSK